MSFADAEDREAAWLMVTDDTLPDLTKVFTTIQARFPRTPSTKATQLYVLHAPEMASAMLTRTTNQRAMLTHRFQLRIVWPIINGRGVAETDQLELSTAIDAVLARVMGLVQDHSHGGRFLSVAEDPERVLVAYPDPELAVRHGEYRASITYSADDFETVN